MQQTYRIQPLKSKRYVFIVSAEIFSILMFLFLAVFLKTANYFIPGGISLIITCYTLYVMKKMSDQSIIIEDSQMHYYMTAGEEAVILFSDVTFAGHYCKNPTAPKFSFNDGLYIYIEKEDRYYLIGSDFENSKRLYEEIEKNCLKAGVKWENIKRENNNSLLEGLKKLLAESSENKK